jgi:preprotein translocase SecE subunit
VNKAFFIQLLIWVVAVGVVFGLAWKQGYLASLSKYIGETRDELKKCSWPTQAELWQSTVLIATTIALIGVFTMVVDFVVLKFVHVLL